MEMGRVDGENMPISELLNAHINALSRSLDMENVETIRLCVPEGESMPI
jgi:hypothetical protein